MGDAARLPDPRLFGHVADLAMDRDEHFGFQPAVERFQLGPPRVARDVDQRLPVGHHLDAARGELVLDLADRDLVARNLARGKQHDVARRQLNRVVEVRHPAQCRTRLALPAGGEDQHLSARQAHRCVEIDRRREILKIAIVLRHLDDPVQ